MSGFSRKLTDFLSTERSRAEIEALSEAECADLGLSREELQSLAASRPQMRQQMLRMAARFGLDKADVSYPKWRALTVVHACKTCARPQACFRYLTGVEEGGFDPSECPNAATYSEIAARKSEAV